MKANIGNREYLKKEKNSIKNEWSTFWPGGGSCQSGLESTFFYNYFETLSLPNIFSS